MKADDGIISDKGSTECPIGWNHFGSSCYFFSHELFNWLDAEFSCRAHNARLAEVQSKEQSTFLVNMCKTKGPGISYWLGGRDDVVEERWMWAQTDHVFNFTDWYPGLPDNIARNENCLHMYAPYKLKWNDVTCAGLYRFICEKEYFGDGSETIG
ncbi:perlucin-like isoform X2 [Mytilus galloprovincialis]|uniref:perlucin-like isoform X2 n=1 Tax=Mytilus galloprovincialis TaxID=29158 RepID=UPI003F7C8A85